ncbi:MAG: hypothetical protein BAJALOKI2v1_300007 [Promethearchaeota archaeon]|nr:MAG: hypothetical protein BAJALOKI2v1_300007 [Candidatus Lokiarchaeota archaeon]
MIFMRRLHKLNRWNYSQKSGKWVYVELSDGKRKYTYRTEPPEQFLELTKKITTLNKRLMNTEDPEENKEIYEKLMKISQELQKMGKPE